VLVNKDLKSVHFNKVAFVCNKWKTLLNSNQTDSGDSENELFVVDLISVY